jgi:hypothetical protein
MVGFVLQGVAQNNPIPSQEERKEKIVRFYPNPAHSEINFDFEKNYDNTYTFTIYNFLGKKMLELQKINPKNQVDLSEFLRGVYIFQLKDKNGRVIETGKFQVVK